MDFVAIDVETANGYPSSVCAIGAVKVEGGKITQRFYELVRPEPDYYAWFCRRVHGLGPDDTDNARVFQYVWQDVMKMVGDLPLVAHNKAFDEKCLRAACRVYQLDWPGKAFYCTLKRSRLSIPRAMISSYSLPYVCEFFGIPFHDHHNALADAEACAKIAMALF